MPLTQEQLDAQNRANGISQYNTGPGKVGGAIGSDMLAPQPAINVSQNIDTTPYTSLLNGGNSVVGANATTLTPPAPESDSNTKTGTQDQLIAELQKLQPIQTAPGYQNAYGGLNDLKQNVNTAATAQQAAQDKYNALQAQLQQYQYNASTLIPTAMQENATGRGITAGGLAPIQAAELRKNALAAAPVQFNALIAQGELAAAQGRTQLAQGIYEQAQSHLDKMYELQVKDAQNQFNYKKDLITQAIAVADKKDAAKLQEKLKEEEWAHQKEVKMMDYAHAERQAKLEAGLKGSTKRDTQVVNGQLIDMQTGEVIKSLSGNSNNGQYQASNGAGVTSIDKNKSTLTQVFNDSKITPANKTAVGNGLSLLSAAEDLANANPGGKFEGINPIKGMFDWATPNSSKSQRTIKNESLISALDLQTQFWASGAALSPEQTALVQKMIPKKSDSDATVRAKTNQLVNYMLSQSASRLITDGVSFVPQTVDLYETKDLLGGASKEQLDQLKAEGLI